MFEKDNQIKYHSLNLWANYIETGDVNMSANDAIKTNNRQCIQPLELEQQKFVIRLRDLANKELNNQKS